MPQFPDPSGANPPGSEANSTHYGVRKQQPQRATGVTAPTGTHVEMLTRTLSRMQDMLAGFGVHGAVPLFPSTATPETIHQPIDEGPDQEVQP